MTFKKCKDLTWSCFSGGFETCSLEQTSVKYEIVYRPLPYYQYNNTPSTANDKVQKSWFGIKNPKKQFTVSE